MQLALKKMPLQSRKDKPVPLPLPHPLWTPEGAEICLFVKDHQGEGHKEAKKRVALYERKGGIAKVRTRARVGEEKGVRGLGGVEQGRWVWAA